MAIHIPMLNEDTDPFTMPIKKKIRMTAQINASKPHNIRNSHNFKSKSSTTKIQPLTDTVQCQRQALWRGEAALGAAKG
jgi:hypothetical protein